jgi:TAG lipase/steryl ester hydrolase/phospholipase A2/LPA acyltransferase
VRAGGSIYRHAATQALDVLRRHAPGDRVKAQFDKAHGVYSQDYGGTDMHVQLPLRPRLYAKMLSNPSLEEFHEYTRLGERATWPLIPMIRDRTRLSRMFGNAIGMLMSRSTSRRPSLPHGRVMPRSPRRI